MKPLIYFITILTIISCTREDIMIGRNILIKEFPQEINLSGEKLDITSIGVNDIFVVDTFLICYKAMGLDEFFDIYSTNTYQSLGKFLSPGRGPNEFLNAIYINLPTPIYRDHDKTVEIQQFDWEGTPIRKFIITNSIISFALDTKNKCIYGFKDNEDIYKYNISNYF